MCYMLPCFWLIHVARCVYKKCIYRNIISYVKCSLGFIKPNSTNWNLSKNCKWKLIEKKYVCSYVAIVQEMKTWCIIICKQEDIKRYLRKISNRDSQIRILKDDAEATHKQLVTKIIEMKQNMEEKTVTDKVRKSKVSYKY